MPLNGQHLLELAPFSQVLQESEDGRLALLSRFTLAWLFLIGSGLIIVRTNFRYQRISVSPNVQRCIDHCVIYDNMGQALFARAAWLILNWVAQGTYVLLPVPLLLSFLFRHSFRLSWHSCSWCELFLLHEILFWANASMRVSYDNDWVNSPFHTLLSRSHAKVLLLSAMFIADEGGDKDGGRINEWSKLHWSVSDLHSIFLLPIQLVARQVAIIFTVPLLKQAHLKVFRVQMTPSASRLLNWVLLWQLNICVWYIIVASRLHWLWQKLFSLIKNFVDCIFVGIFR